MASTQECAAMEVMFSNKFKAALVVKLINGDGEDPAQVYGEITCRFGTGRRLYIFKKSQAERIDVRPGESIPLEHDPWNVDIPPTATEMEIEAYLKDYDSFSFNDEIANGKVVFQMKDPGVREKKPINGKYGSIEVDVLWG